MGTITKSSSWYEVGTIKKRVPSWIDDDAKSRLGIYTAFDQPYMIGIHEISIRMQSVHRQETLAFNNVRGTNIAWWSVLTSTIWEPSQSDNVVCPFSRLFCWLTNVDTYNVPKVMVGWSSGLVPTTPPVPTLSVNHKPQVPKSPSPFQVILLMFGHFTITCLFDSSAVL